jgi:hypothetical protein
MQFVMSNLKTPVFNQNTVAAVVIGILFCQALSMANQNLLFIPENENPTNQHSLPSVLSIRNLGQGFATLSLPYLQTGAARVQAMLASTTITLIQLGDDENIRAGTKAVLSKLKDIQISVVKPATLAEFEAILAKGYTIVIGHGLSEGFMLGSNMYEWSTLYAIVSTWFAAEHIFLLMCHSQEGLAQITPQIPTKIKALRGIVDSEVAGVRAAYQIFQTILQSFRLVYSKAEYHFLENLYEDLQTLGMELFELTLSKFIGDRSLLLLEKPPIYFKWSLKLGWFSAKLKLDVKSQVLRFAGYIAATTAMVGIAYFAGIPADHIMLMLADAFIETFFEIPGGWVGRVIKDLVLYTLIPVILDVFAPQLGRITDAAAIARQRAVQSFMDKYFLRNGGRTFTKVMSAFAAGVLSAPIWAITFYSIASGAAYALKNIILPPIAWAFRGFGVTTRLLWNVVTYGLWSAVWKTIILLPSLILAMIYRHRHQIPKIVLGAFAVWFCRLLMHTATEYAHLHHLSYRTIWSFTIKI